MTSALAQLVVVLLEGQPADRELPILPLGGTRRIVEETFGELLAPGCRADVQDDFSAGVAPRGGGLRLVYVVGHVWRTCDRGWTAVRAGGKTEVIPIDELLRRLAPLIEDDNTLLMVDTCHAGLFLSLVEKLERRPRLVVTASGVDEQAIAVPLDSATRFALALSLASRRLSPLDVVGLVSEAARKLASDGVIPGQHVDYLCYGRRVVLSRRGDRTARRRERTVAVIRTLLVAIGIVIAVGAIIGGAYYHQHALVEINLGHLTMIADGLRVSIYEEDPATNTSYLRQSLAVEGRDRLRLRVPARDILIRVEAHYADDAPRALAFHMVLSGGFLPSSKMIRLSPPSARDVELHPGMAFVPRVRWLVGRDLRPALNDHEFWIDIAPPTVNEYLPFVRALEARGLLSNDESILLRAAESRTAREAVGLKQMETLGRDLADIFVIVERATAERPTGAGDIVAEVIEMPCPGCPAPMTRREAEVYCAARGKRLPTDLEWELAARGVDGRIYPWGDRFDAAKANVVGLPDKGAAPPTLQPIAQYAAHPSPFGLVDLIGNAGDWVVNATGSYERVYMGGTYRFNPEDATTFLQLPVTESDLTVKEITVRCASSPRP